MVFVVRMISTIASTIFAMMVYALMVWIPTHVIVISDTLVSLIPMGMVKISMKFYKTSLGTCLFWTEPRADKIISNIAIIFSYPITISWTFSSYRDISKSWLNKIISSYKKIAIVSQIRNSTETKSGQPFQLSDVRNKSELLQKYVHTMQMNLWFIVTLVEGYVPVVIGSKAIMCEWNKSWYMDEIVVILPKPIPYPTSYQVSFWVIIW